MSTELMNLSALSALATVGGLDEDTLAVAGVIDKVTNAYLLRVVYSVSMLVVKRLVLLKTVS